MCSDDCIIILDFQIVRYRRVASDRQMQTMQSLKSLRMLRNSSISVLERSLVSFLVLYSEIAEFGMRRKQC